MHIFKLTTTQARRAATAIAARVHDMDANRPPQWHETPTTCTLTQSDQRYRAELMDAYDALMSQLPQ